MPEWQEVMSAESQANAAQRYLETYLGSVEEGDREADQALTLGLAAVALCERLSATATYLGYYLGASHGG